MSENPKVNPEYRLAPWDRHQYLDCESEWWDEGVRMNVELHFGSKKTGKLSIVFEDLSRNFVLFWTEVKPYEWVLFWTEVRPYEWV